MNQFNHFNKCELMDLLN